MSSPSQLAKVALDLIARTSVQADDSSLTIAMQARAMLHKIVSGHLVVVEPNLEARSEDET